MSLRKYLKVLALLLFPIVGFSASVTIYNDSSFVLNASVLDAQGVLKGQVTVAPRHTIQWQDSQLNINTYSESPFTVILTCTDGTEYGVHTNVAENSRISANSSRGRHSCKPQSQSSNRRHGKSTGIEDVQEQLYQ